MRKTLGLIGILPTAFLATVTLGAPDFPAFADVSKGYTRVISAPGESTLFTLMQNKKDEQLLAELPRGWESKKFFIAATPSAGNIFAGLQGPARYVYFKRYGKRIAIVEPNLTIRSTGEKSSRDSVNKIFTDNVLLDLPIVALGPNKQPVIDLDELCVRNAGRLAGANLNARLAKISKAKAFPKNIEIEVEAPDSSGNYKGVHYSISVIPGRGSYKPREADDRIGYFTTHYRDLGQYGTENNYTRYINRWNLEKRDPKLKLSPPKKPIVYYIDHTVPVRYRRFVRDGILQWNEAFRAIGIDNAIEVYQQDEVTGTHMDKDPEDVRYNFVRWLNNNIATAIGPSRAHPETGEILDADIVLTDGWIRAFYGWYEGRPHESVESLNEDALTWFEDFPQWDPRLVMLSPTERAEELARRETRRAAGDPDPADSRADMMLSANPELAEALMHSGQECNHCLAALGKARDMAYAGVTLETMGIVDRLAGDADQGETIDGVPEWFIGPQLEHLVAHEVGHTLGLRHNFKASSIYDVSEVNSEDFKGKIPNAGSVMDYQPTNFNVDENAEQGDYVMIGIGPYDMWAIEYGYTSGDPKEVVKKVGDPKHVYLTDGDTRGPDPLARRYDFGANPLDYAEGEMKMVRMNRDRLLSEYVKDGDSWERARKGYSITLNQQRKMIDMMANWVGGTHVSRVRKGDPDTGAPLTPVDPDKQRAALDFVIENALQDDAYGLTPELLNAMTVEQWGDPGSMRAGPTWAVHGQVAGMQQMALSLVINPQRMGWIQDNEMRTPSDEDAVTIPEVFGKFYDAVYTELEEGDFDGDYTEREPMISSLRRNLQATMTDRLIMIANGKANMSLPTRQSAMHFLRKLNRTLGESLEDGNAADADMYTLAHLEDMHMRTKKALDAIYVAE